MKTRFICQSVQWAAGWKIDGGEQPGPWISHHVVQCPHCTAWLARQGQVLGQICVWVETSRADYADTPLMTAKLRRQRRAVRYPDTGFPWAKILSLTGALAALTAAVAVWQPWESPTPSRQPLEDWRIAFQETLKKAQEPSALEKEFQAILSDAERAMYGVAEGVGTRELAAGWPAGN